MSNESRPGSRARALGTVLGVAAALIVSAVLSTSAAWAQPAADPEPESTGMQAFLEYLADGDFKANIRLRWENARIDHTNKSNALTLRTRLGYGLKPWHGLSAFVEFENIATATDHEYFDGIGATNRHTLIADPGVTEVNQAYAKYALGEIGSNDLSNFKTYAIAGRQRIKLDDDRFIGNVGWRQNEQTYDGALGSTSLGLEGLNARYAYLWRVQRIFGNRGTKSNRKDFESDSHLVNIRYDRFPWLQGTAFAYVLDFERSPNPTGPANSSSTLGFRLNGSQACGDDWKILYAGSFAHQQESGGNPTSYAALYGAVDLAAAFAPAGMVGAGYEVLGSDDGKAQFRTPLATGHKFNGWADVWLDNGGSAGLRNFYAYVAPKLPWDLKGKLVYHRFWSDSKGTDRGGEIDAVLSRKFLKYLTVLTKVSYYDGRNKGRADGGRADRYRFWLELTFAY